MGSAGRRIGRLALVAALVITSAACVSMYRNHGYVPTPRELGEIKPGVDTRDSVTQAIGAPGTSGILNDGDYYYVATRFRHYGARAPEPVSRQLVAINFDSRGIVRNIQRYELADGQVIALERRITDNGASDGTFLRQLLGNLGRIGPGTIVGDG